MPWFYGPLLPGGAQQQSSGVTELTTTTGHLVISGKVASINVALGPAAGHLVSAGHEPTISVGTILTTETGHLTITGRTASLTATIAPAAGHLSIGGKTASITQALAPGAGHLVITGHEPTVSITGPVSLTPTTGHLVISGHVPTVVQPGGEAYHGSGKWWEEIEAIRRRALEQSDLEVMQATVAFLLNEE